MLLIAQKNKVGRKGVSLIEVMIALVVLLIVFMALMQTALVSIEANMNNVLRDEAVSIAEQVINGGRSVDFDTLVTNNRPEELNDLLLNNQEFQAGAYDGVKKTTSWQVLRNIRNVRDFPVTVELAIRDRGASNKQMDVTVTWKWKAVEYKHYMSTIRMRT